MGFILAFIAVFFTYLFSPFLIIYGMVISCSLRTMNDYFFNIAVAVDRLGNVIAGPFLNHAAITPRGYKYGNGKETISSGTGKNHIKQPREFRLFGRSIRYYLDQIEKDHCVNSIGQ